MRAAAVVLCVALGGCGTARFTLPDAGEAARGRYQWRPGGAVEQPRADFDAGRIAAPRVFRFGQFYYNLYSAWDGASWTTGLTASLDGRDWSLGRKVLAADSRTWEGEQRAAFGAALVADGLIHYWYTAGGPAAIGLARSHDGRSWRREGEPVLKPGGEKDFDGGGVSHPAVLRLDGTYYLYYTGVDAGGRAAIGLARSDDGVEWKRLRGNPVMAGAPGGGVAVWRAQGRYWMLAPAGEGRVALARSADGVTWIRAGLEFEAVLPGVLVEEGRVRVWSEGGAGELVWSPE